MAYSINPNLPKARALAMQLLVREQLPLLVVARKCGVHRTTVWRWKKKWDKLNVNVQLINFNRPNRSKTTSSFRLAACTWRIPTTTSKPHHHPWSIPDEIIQQILIVRRSLRRCILRRHHCFDGARKKRVRSDNPRRPHVTKPGELVQVDTIHHVDPYSGRRLYFYTVIDLYTIMAYARMSTSLRQGLAVQSILEAQVSLGFNFSMVQSDNGAEFSRYFEQKLRAHNIQLRHSRLHRPNDNTHIERFNRTIQEECIGHYWRKNIPLPRLKKQLSKYLDYYNHERVHLGLQLKTPSSMLQRY